jgi:hypothetical protein
MIDGTLLAASYKKRSAVLCLPRHESVKLHLRRINLTNNIPERTNR